MAITLYSWKTYKCVKCKDDFKGSELYRLPTGWNYDVRICRTCYKLVK